MKMYVECCKAKDSDKTYHALKVDFGYRVAVISMEKDICAELINYPISKLYAMKLGDVVDVKVI